MYVSDSCRAAFIHIPKTGGTAIRNSLLVHMDCDRVGHKHGTVEDLPYGCWNYFLFAMVRNPYRRLASKYRYHYILAPDRRRFAESFPTMASFLERQMERRAANGSVPPFSQVEFIDDRVRWYCFEVIGEAVEDLCRRLGIGPVKLRQGTSTNYYGGYDWREFMDRRALEFINDECRADFETFGYDMLTWGEIRG